MRRVSRLVVAILIASAAVAGALVLDSGSPATEGTLSTAASSNVQEFDSTTFAVTTYGNGTATFTIRYERRLANESEVDQFETFADRFENESTDLYAGFQSRADSLTSTGRNVTGREMTASNFQRRAEVQERFNTLGVVEMSFQWSSFAVVRDDGRIAVGDVFEGGIYLGPNQALVFRHGPDVRFESVDPEGSTSGDTLTGSDSVTWAGEHEFGDNRPRVVFAPADQVTTTTATNDGGGSDDVGTGDDGGPSTDQAGDGDGLDMLPMIALAIVLVLVAAFAYRTYGDDLVTTDDGGAGAGPAGTGGSDSGAGGGTGDASTSGAAAASTPSEPAVSDEELLTDEDRVRQLLEDHGGRMRQVNIVDETGWSKSKVSMLLSDMEDDGQLSKLRVGRENIVSLDGHEPDVAGSPFDDDQEDT